MSSPLTFGQRFKANLNDNLSALNKSAGRSVKELAYKVFVVAQEQGVLVEAWLPETVAMDVNATYDAPYAQGIGEAMPSLGSLARFLGMNLTTQALTAQIWQGGAWIEFNLPLIFQSETSGAADVMEPIKDLYRLTMPKDPAGGGLLEAPGPRIDIEKLARNGGRAAWNAATDAGAALTNPGAIVDVGKQIANDPIGMAARAPGFLNKPAQVLSTAIVNSIKNNISLHIGQFLYFSSVVITDVSPTFDIVLGPDRNPVRASVVINFRTFYIPTDRDIQDMFPATAGLRSSRGGDRGTRGGA